MNEWKVRFDDDNDGYDEDIEDGFMSYRIYIDGWESMKWSDVAVIGAKLLKDSKDLTVGHLWGGDRFRLAVVKGPDGHGFCLRGLQYIEDDIQDEWKTIGTLRTLTENHNDITACVQDADGEPLLIEAAEALPEWVEPSAIRNRVWLRGGMLHVVGYPATPSDIGTLPGGPRAAVSECLETIRRIPDRTVASDAVQTAILNRIERNEEDCLLRRSHKAHCMLSHEASIIFASCPHLIQRSATAYRGRSREDITRIGCHSLPSVKSLCKSAPVSTAEGEGEQDGRICRCINFTRTSYAQLAFDEPCEPLPVMHGHPRFKAWSLGSELEVGLRLLLESGKKQIMEDGKDLATGQQSYETGLKEFLEEAQQRVEEVDKQWLEQCYFECLRSLPNMDERDPEDWRIAVKALQSFKEEIFDDDDEKDDSDKWLKNDDHNEQDAKIQKIEAEQKAFFDALSGSDEFDDETMKRELFDGMQLFLSKSSVFGDEIMDEDDGNDDDTECGEDDDDELIKEIKEMEQQVQSAIEHAACVAPLLASRNTEDSCAESMLNAVREHNGTTEK